MSLAVRHGLDPERAADSSLASFCQDNLHKVPLFHQPGASFQYGTSVDWLTRIVEEVSGLDLATYVQRYIFE